MNDFFNNINVSDKITLLGILVSLIVGIISTIIAVMTLRQNSKNILEGNRAYVVLYIHRAFGDFYTSIHLKNYGKSGAFIHYVKTSPDIMELLDNSKVKNLNPLPCFKNIFLAPEQCISVPFEFIKDRENAVFDVEISYQTLSKTIVEKYTVNLHYLSVQGFSTTTASNELQALNNINQNIRGLLEK